MYGINCRTSSKQTNIAIIGLISTHTKTQGFPEIVQYYTNREFLFREFCFIHNFKRMKVLEQFLFHWIKINLPLKSIGDNNKL